MLNDTEIQILQAAVAAGSEGSVYVDLAVAGNLRAQGYIGVNEAVVEPGSNRVAARVTPAGLELANSLAAQATSGASWMAPAVPATPSGDGSAPAVPSVPPVGATSRFVVQHGAVLPKTKRKPPVNPRIGQTLYPIDALDDIGAYIFVPATPEKPKPARSLQSTVGNANKRYAHTNPVRVFRVREVEQGVSYGSFVAPANGAIIIRVDPATVSKRVKKEKAVGAVPPVPATEIPPSVPAA